MVQPSADVRRTAALDAQGGADLCRQGVVAHVEGEGRPVGVDEHDAPAGTHHPGQLGDRGHGVRQPLQRSLAPGCVERRVRLVEPDGIADVEPHPSRGSRRPISGDAEHLGRRVDADRLTTLGHVVSEGEGRVAEPAPHVEQPVTIDEAQLLAFPRPELLRRLPPGGRFHHGDEHVDVRSPVDLPVPEPMGILGPHARTLRRGTAEPGGRRPFGDAARWTASRVGDHRTVR